MQERPLVSFIVGVHNTKRISDLDRSIESMLNQTYQNKEIVICDDASTNGVYEYLMNRYSDNPNIQIIRNKCNSGLGVSLNNCLKEAQGQYIARHDDDDYIDPTKLEKQMRVLENNPEYSFVSTGLHKFDEQGTWDTIIPKERPQKRDFRFHSQHVHAATVFTRNCLEAVQGYRISTETQRAEDYDLFMRLYASGYKGYNLQEPLYYYNFPRGNQRRIRYTYKVKEAIVRYKGFKKMGLPIVDYVFVLKPLVAGLLPENIKMKIKKILRGLNKNEN